MVLTGSGEDPLSAMPSGVAILACLVTMLHVTLICIDMIVVEFAQLERFFFESLDKLAVSGGCARGCKALKTCIRLLRWAFTLSGPCFVQPCTGYVASVALNYANRC